MRIITGSARGRKVKTIAGLDIRPTADLVKEAMFSAIQFEIEGKIILDLFAGSGQLGLEALSRGAEKAFFVDNLHQSIITIKENLSSLDFLSKAAVNEMPASAFIRSTSEKFDLAFLDPPYEKRHLQKILPALCEIMSENSVIICEHEAKCDLPMEINNFKISKQYKYGQTGVTLLRNS